MPSSDIPFDSLETLRAALAAGASPDYLFFWGHRPSRDGSIGKTCMSQWFPAAFEIGGERYATAEHYMMAAKARLFGDAAIAAQVLQAPDPGAAKALGRKIAGFDEALWLARRSPIVEAANAAKFGQNPALREFLLNTGGKVLVEASPVDAIWGIGLAHDDPRASDPAQWPGLNLLGFALMRVRAGLRGAA
jgi:ribA/ribD-fused uncharacterized protein